MGRNAVGGGAPTAVVSSGGITESVIPRMSHMVFCLTFRTVLSFDMSGFYDRINIRRCCIMDRCDDSISVVGWQATACDLNQCYEAQAGHKEA